MKNQHAGIRVRNDSIDGSQDLVLALEMARTQFAVAIASEGKSTLLVQWREYIETEQRVRRLLKSLRTKTPAQPDQTHRHVVAMELLARVQPVGEPIGMGTAGRLCRRLSKVLAVLEDR